VAILHKLYYTDKIQIRYFTY